MQDGTLTKQQQQAIPQFYTMIHRCYLSCKDKHFLGLLKGFTVQIVALKDVLSHFYTASQNVQKIHPISANIFEE
jgi:hypothetical protein